ncbi:MAG: hypothetical protein LBQ54_00900 [Planctomycetaceae bacterium]|jgi:hypothetical protein|nr:hypothetical protein [Planctomycetaceae bacterium]
MTVKIFQNDTITILGRHDLLVAGRRIQRSDLQSVRYTVFETESLQSGVFVPVPEFENVEVPVHVCFFDELQDITIQYDIGGSSTASRTVEANCVLVIAPSVQTSGDGTQTFYPLRTKGMFYRVVIYFELNDPTIAPFTHTEEIEAT